MNFSAIIAAENIKPLSTLFDPIGRRLRIWISVCIFLSAILTTATSIAASTAEPVENSKSENVQSPPPAGLADLIPEAASLNQRLVRLTLQLGTMPQGDQIQTQLLPLNRRLDELIGQLTEIKQQERRQYERLLEFRANLETVKRDLVVFNEPLTDGLRKIDQLRSDWQTDQAHWEKWRSGISEDVEIVMVQGAFDDAMQTIAIARERIRQQTESMMRTQKQAFDLQVRIDEMMIELNALIEGSRGEILHDFSPSMYTSTYFAQFDRWLVYDLLSGLAAVPIPDLSFFARRGWVILLQVLLILIIAYGIRRSEFIQEGSQSLRFMRLRPYTVGCLLSAALCWDLYGPMPTMWRLLMQIVMLTATARLLAKIVDQRSRIVMVYVLVAIMLITNFLIIIELPSPLFRIYIVTISTGLAAWCVRLLLRRPKPKRSRIAIAILVLITAGSAAVVGIEVFGYSALALHIFQSTLVTVFIVILAWLAILLLRGLLESFLRSRAVRKIPFLQNQADTIVERGVKFVQVLVLLLFSGAILQTWRVFTSSWDLMGQLLAFGFTIGEKHITIGLVLIAAVCLYGALFASRILQFFLMRDVFLRRQVDSGIGLSITRLLHYAFVLLGVFLALATLGFELTNLAIIASALSVGIGFGLQTIVNNFVCGLILLFERPVKVGDVIQLGEQWATIRNIGLRATTIQTFDQSDIVVPNSDLIANQVTNWTLGNRRIRLILTVGVAYGSDVPAVLKILEECSQNHPRVSQNPAPSIFFMAFGDSSLDFQLRVWIDDIDYMNVVRSELNQEIDRQFRERGIEIPFPQRDIHLRSMAPTATEVLSASAWVNPKIVDT
jgi:small-conductance mechanosensitive channel